MADSKKAAAGHPSSVTWLPEPEDHDFPAAASYLALVGSADQVTEWMAALRGATRATFKAKDLLRASRLDLLAPDNPHVAHDLAKVRAGKPLSPILVVRGDLARGIPAQIADGYHRVCASYHTDENTDIPVWLAAPGA